MVYDHNFAGQLFCNRPVKIDDVIYDQVSTSKYYFLFLVVGLQKKRQKKTLINFNTFCHGPKLEDQPIVGHLGNTIFEAFEQIFCLVFINLFWDHSGTQNPPSLMASSRLHHSRSCRHVSWLFFDAQTIFSTQNEIRT